MPRSRRRRKHWKDLSGPARAGVVGAAAVQFALTAAALRDVLRRSPEELNGPRWAWIAASFVNFVGPIAYFVAGRRR